MTRCGRARSPSSECRAEQPIQQALGIGGALVEALPELALRVDGVVHGREVISLGKAAQGECRAVVNCGRRPYGIEAQPDQPPQQAGPILRNPRAGVSKDGRATCERYGPARMVTLILLGDRVGDLALSPARARRLLARPRARRRHAADDLPLGRRSPRSCRRATRPTASRRASARCLRRTIRRSRSCWSTTTANDHTPTIARNAAAACRCSRAIDGGHRPTAADRLDRQALGREAGHRGSRGAFAEISPAHRRRHHARPRHAELAGRARRSAWAGAHLAHGAMALRQSRRARAHPGLHLLLPDALSVPLGEPARTTRWRARPAAACWCGPMRCASPAASR